MELGTQGPGAAAIAFGFRAFPAVLGHINHTDKKERAGIGWQRGMEGDFKGRESPKKA